MPNTESSFHSEEAQEILGRIPSWTVRWGISVIFLIFLGIILLSCLIKFPERVTGSITITTGNSPVDVISKGSGTIDTILVKNDDTVAINDILCIIGTNAKAEDILTIDRLLSNVEQSISDIVFEDWIYNDYSLGNLQSEWSSFSSACYRYKDYIERSVIARREEHLIMQIQKMNILHSQMKNQETILQEDFRYQIRSYQRDSMLYSKKVIPEAEFESSSRKLLQAENTLRSFESQLTNTELSILQNEQQLVELAIQRQDDILVMEQDILNSIQRLKSLLGEWRISNTLTAPIAGRVTYIRKWDKGQFISASESFLTIIPMDSSNVVGIVRIPQESFGKVQVGQKAHIRLSGYPYIEYGMLTGTVGYLSSVPEASTHTSAINAQNQPQYIAEVIFPEGLITTYGKQLRLIQNMNGTVEIITEDKRLINRLLNPITALFKSGI